MVKLFGTTINEAIAAFPSASLGGRTAHAATQKDDRMKAISRIVMSFLLILIGVYFIGVNKGNSQTVGASMISAICGYWLK